jgi:sigma-B regulation protein RsbU (phosphoserine phosphatase)
VRGGHGHRFVTYVAAILDPQTHQLTIANAGHLPPLLKKSDQTVERMGVDGALIFEETVFDLAPGDAVVLYTDGVTEATNAANDLYGMKRLIKCIADAPPGIGELGEQLIADVEEFCGGRAQRDDICLLGFRRLQV